MAAPRFRLTPPDPLELDIHEQAARALDRLLLPPAQWCCYPAGHVQLAAHEVARLVKVGLKRAYPDLLIFHAKVWGVELKRPGGKLSRTFTDRTKSGRLVERIGQADMFPLLLKTGAFGGIAVVETVEAMLHQLKTWGVPLRPFFGRPMDPSDG